MSNAAAAETLRALTARLDFFAQTAEDRGLVDAESDPIPARGSAEWPSSHPRWIAFLDLCIARSISIRGVGDQPTQARSSARNSFGVAVP